MKLCISIFSAIFLTLHATFIIGQNTPEEIVLAYFQNFKNGDIEALSDLIHKEQLEKFQKMLMPTIEKAFRMKKATQFIEAFAEGDSLEQVQQYTPKKFYQRFFNLCMVIKCSKKMEILQNAEVKPLGHVIEGDMIHVTYRINTEMLMDLEKEPVKISDVCLVSLKKDGENWKLLLMSDIEAMAKVFRMILGER